MNIFSFTIGSFFYFYIHEWYDTAVHCPSWMSQSQFTVLAIFCSIIFQPECFLFSSSTPWNLYLFTHAFTYGVDWFLNVKNYKKIALYPWYFHVWPDFITLWLIFWFHWWFFQKNLVQSDGMSIQYMPFWRYVANVVFILKVVK